MRERPSHPVKPAVRKTTLAVDVVVLSPQADTLAALLVRAASSGRERWSLPWDAPLAGEGLEDAAARITEAALGTTPALLEHLERKEGTADLFVDNDDDQGIDLICKCRSFQNPLLSGRGF